MRKSYRLSLALLGLLATARPPEVTADVEEMTNGMPEYARFVSKTGRLRVSDVNDPDTVYIGHIADPAWRPRDKDGAPMTEAAFPSIQTGGYGPYRIGRGEMRPGIGPGAHYNGVWDFDHFGGATPAQGGFPARAAEGDSLLGWWPLARPYQSGDAVNVDDKARPFFGLDYGNAGNYVINQGSPTRTFGVTSYWHRDVGRNSAPLADTGAVIPGPNVEWKPIGGGASAWCGLRAAGDATHVDPITGNAYNQTVLSYRGNNSYFQQGSHSTLGTDQNFPGYGSQWDQMLYQDVVLTGNADLSVTFDYATAMSRVRGGASTQRIGYFYEDPKKPVAANDGNFISATDAELVAGGPVDSFMVYIGRPVDDFNCRYSNGDVTPVYDPQRRWFSEVLRLDAANGLGQIQQVLSVAGVTGAMAADGTLTPVHAVIPVAGANLQSKGIIDGGGGTVRIVFRVKTNRGSDDEDYGAARSFTSGTRGAAVIDNVSITQGGGNLVDFGDFENPGAIDNDTATPATSAWKSTGKPPGIYVHVGSVDQSLGSLGLPWNDPCSTPNFADPSAVDRDCNMIGNVLTGGDRDLQEKPGGVFGSPDQDRARWVASPTINLKSNGPGDYNGQGIDAEIADADDWVLTWDYHSPGFRGNINGNFFSVGMQCFPARQPNGLNVWGETRHSLTIFFQAVQGCFTTSFSPKTNGLVLTSNPSGIPDSTRVYFQFLSRCFTFSHSASTCSPVSPSVLTGSYIDNLSFGLVNAVSPPGLAVAPWFKFSDAFPATSTINFASSNFDTCAAWVKSGVNAYLPNIGLAKPSIQGDTAWVTTGVAPGLRVDMVFRILPGVGNYVQIGNRASGIRRVPTSTAAATTADGGNGALTPTQRFWGAYMADNGAFGTGGNGVTGPGHLPGNRWDPHRWNSARMDTIESNLFPCLNLGPNIPALDASQWMTTYHEADPKFTVLGAAKNRCFVVDPSLGRGTSCRSLTTTSVTTCNLICGPHPVSATYPPLWTQDLTSGLPISENGLPAGRTYEYTKIIPDGLLTPGAHVQYFFRRSPGQSALVDHLPDTNFVFNPFADAARWYHFSVLPDRWKDPAFAAGGTGMACMLVDDVDDRNFDELYWVSMADSIGLTYGNKRGAHNGWRARGDQAEALLSNVGADDTIARRDNGGQPGSLWDLWNTTAGEAQTTGAAWLSNRAAMQPGATELTANKGARTGPTGDMLRAFYRTLVFLTGNLTTSYFGRVPNRTDDDIALLNDFALIPGGMPKPRSVFVIGSGFAEDLAAVTGGPAFLGTYFGASLRSPVYRTFSGNTRQIAAYDPVPGTALDDAGGAFGLNGQKFGLANGCGLENDVLSVNVAVPTATAQVRAENVGAAGPYVMSIYAPNGGTREHITYYDGTRIQRIGGIISFDPTSGAPVPPIGSAGFRVYMFKALSIVAGGLGCGPQGPPVGVGDASHSGRGSAFVDFMNLRSSNPMRSGGARIVFGLAKTEKVRISVYDVTGRRIRMVADRVFPGGQEHRVFWDGTSDGGVRVRSGIYFYRLETSTWTSQRKLAVLTD